MPIPIIGGGGAATATGPTALTIRNGIARDFMFWLETQVTTTATLGDLTRVVLADELRDDEAGYEMPGLMWLYARNGAQAGTSRRVIASDAGHLGPMGAVTVSRPFSAALASGITIDATGPLPMRQVGMVRGLHELMNDGLHYVWTEARLEIDGSDSDNGYEHDLSAYPWLTRYEQTRGIYDTFATVTGMPELLSPYPYSLKVDGAERTLITTYPYASQTFHLAVIVRADRLIYDGAAWSYVTIPGLQNDTDQAACPEEWAVKFGLWRACRYARMYLRRARIDPEIKASLLDEVQQRLRSAIGACEQIKLHEMPQPLPEPRDSMVGVPLIPSWP